MGVEDLQRILRQPARVCINPTDASLAYPHGGTALGLTKDAILSPNQKVVLWTTEGSGIVPVDGVDLGRAWVLGLGIRGWDDDAISTIFPATVVGGSSGRTGIVETQTNSARPGALLTARAVSVLLSPDDLDRHPMVLLRRALPYSAETLEIPYQHSEEVIMAVVFAAMPNATGQIIDVHLQEDIVI